MLDMNLIRTNPQAVVEGLAKRGYQADLTDLLAWDERRRALLQKNEAVKAERNRCV